MTTIRNLAMQWFNQLSSAEKTRLVDNNYELFAGIRRWETITGSEIETIFLNEIIIKWWENLDSEYTTSLIIKHFPNTTFDYPKMKEIYLKEHTKEQPSNLYCVSSNALVYSKPCEKWCGDEHCLKNEQPKDIWDEVEAEYINSIDYDMEHYYMGFIEFLQKHYKLIKKQ